MAIPLPRKVLRLVDQPDRVGRSRPAGPQGEIAGPWVPGLQAEENRPQLAVRHLPGEVGAPRGAEAIPGEDDPGHDEEAQAPRGVNRRPGTGRTTGRAPLTIQSAATSSARPARGQVRSSGKTQLGK